MNEIIRKRKSVRKYDLAPLDAATLDAVRAEINKVKPLYPDINFSVEIVSKSKGLFGIKAPHYLIFTSDEKDGYLENIGFIGQQLDLYFSVNGFGSCWLGASKSGEKLKSDLPHVIALAFGKPAEPLHRELSAFKRKPLSAISEGDSAFSPDGENDPAGRRTLHPVPDPRIEAARLAPSAMNMQNWFFIANNGKIHCYRKKLNPLLGLIYDKMVRVDMGIAICHIATESEGFSFVKTDSAPVRKGLIYTGTVA